MAQVISAVQEKGGAGKTTLVTFLAALMAEDGARVAVIDTDPQKNFLHWAEKGQTDIDYIYEENDEKLLPLLNRLKPQYDTIFIDTAGFKSAMSIYAISASNLVLVPSKASEVDARGAVATYRHIQNVATNMGKQVDAFIVLSDVDKATNITSAVIESLDTKSIPRLEAICWHRTGFKEMHSTGRAPSGSAGVVARSILANLQQKKLIEFYEDRTQWAKSA